MSYKDNIYPPSRAATVSIDEFERRIKRKDALDWGIDFIDNRVVPAVPGDLITILGRPGMGKSMLSIYLTKRFSKLVTGEKDIIVYATWETMVEEFVGIFTSPESGYTLEDIARGRADITKIKRAMVKVLGNKIVIFGRSMQNRENFNPPTLLDLDYALEELRKQGYNVKAVLVDYAQAIPSMDNKIAGSESGKVTQVSENIMHCKNIGMRHGCPTFLAAQARRDVDDYQSPKLPALHDGQHTSVIEQASDKVFSVTMPSKYMEVGLDALDLNGWRYKVEETTFCVKMLKQRFGPCAANDIWMLRLDPANLTVGKHDCIGRAPKKIDPDDIKGAF